MMQKNRNRTFKNSFQFSKEFLQCLPSLNKFQQNSHGGAIQNDVFEKERKVTKNHTRSSSFDCDSLTNESDLDIISFGKSSSSSISWSEDFDSETAIKVQDELERMDRILRGKEAIPPNYNEDEYKQWMETFPNIRIIKNTNSSPSSQLEGQHDLLQNPYYHFESAEKCKLDIKTIVKEPIDLSFACNMQSNLKILQTDFKTTNNLKESLKVSPILLENSGCRSNYLNTRQQSSLAVSRSEKLSTKWMKGDARHEYSSLPYVSSSKNKMNYSAIRKKNDKFKHTSTVSLYKSNCVSLPPIKTISFPSAYRYRPSVSPRILHKSSSATTQFEAKMKSKYLHKIGNCDSELNTLRKLHK